MTKQANKRLIVRGRFHQGSISGVIILNHNFAVNIKRFTTSITCFPPFKVDE